MRYLAAPWLGMLESGAWLRNARHANAMAARLHEEVRGLPGAKVVRPPQANSLFLELPSRVAEGMRARGWRFYDFIGGAYRLMCSWDTQEEDVLAFADDLRGVSGTELRAPRT
jgi:threonine aldolase